MERFECCLVFLAILSYFFQHTETSAGTTISEDIKVFYKRLIMANFKRPNKVLLPVAEIKCKGRYDEVRNKTSYCHCDRKCEGYGDCCYDYWSNNVDKTLNMTYHTRDSKVRCLSDVHHQHIDPLYWYPRPINIPRLKGHMVNITCPNSVMSKKCSAPDDEDEIGAIPVEAGLTTYRNRYCALCNGFTEEDLVYWEYELMCSKLNASEISTDHMRRCFANQNSPECGESKRFFREKCTWFFVPPEGISKTNTICSPLITCPQTPAANMSITEHLELVLKCNTYMLVVYRRGRFYKNFHCALCYGVEPEDLEQPPSLNFVSISLFFDTPRPKYNHHEFKVNNNINASLDNNKTLGVSKRDKQNVTGEGYLTMVGLVVSMFSLVVLLVLYFMVKTLRTTPGKIIIGLSISLIFYQALLFAGDKAKEDNVACSILAILLHYSIMTAFSWMAIMSFDVWRTFGMKSSVSLVKNNSTFRFYCLFTFVEPLTIIITAIVIDQTHVMTVYWRDGANTDSLTECWIIEATPHLIFFLIPVGITLAFNIIALLWTVIGIHRVKAETRRFNNDCNQVNNNVNDNGGKKKTGEFTTNVKMYAKLSVVMGLTWVLGFTIKYSLVMRYVYIVLNSFQGFLIFLAFVVNQRVLDKYRQYRGATSSRGTGSSSVAGRSVAMDVTRQKNTPSSATFNSVA